MAYCVRIAPLEVATANQSHLLSIPVISGIAYNMVDTIRCLEEAIGHFVIDDDDDACPDEEFALSQVSDAERGEETST